MSLVSWLAAGTWQKLEGNNWQNTLQSDVLNQTTLELGWGSRKSAKLTSDGACFKVKLFQKKLTCHFKGWQWLQVTVLHAPAEGSTGGKPGRGQQKPSAISPTTHLGSSGGHLPPRGTGCAFTALPSSSYTRWPEGLLKTTMMKPSHNVCFFKTE